MTTQPTLRTERLSLRPFARADAPVVQRLAGERDVAVTTVNLPHPYADGIAEHWIESHAPRFVEGKLASFAITLVSDGSLIGAIALVIARLHDSAELGFWVGKPWWGQGIATEAGRAAVHYGFTGLGLNRIHACHFVRNPASGRVLRKIGLVHEGTHRHEVKKWGSYEDTEHYAVLRSVESARRIGTPGHPGLDDVEGLHERMA